VKKILAFQVEQLDRLVEVSSIEFVNFLKLLMAPKKQNRFASSKDALHAFDRRDSNIFLSVSPLYTSPKNRLFLILSGAVLFIVALILFLPNRVADSKKINQTGIPLDSDSTSLSAMKDSSRKFSANTSLRAANELDQKSASPLPKAVLPAEVHQAALDSGVVLVTSTPWAKVYIDDKFIGETPFGKPLALAAGKHSILFVHPSFDPIAQTINVLPLKEIPVNGNFFETVGYLNCLVTPWAEVYINDQYKDTTPLDKPIMLSPGKYQVRFKNASFQDIVREVLVRSKDTISIVISFTGQR
jgi:hypothetical protein